MFDKGKTDAFVKERVMTRGRVMCGAKKKRARGAPKVFLRQGNQHVK
ncbi:hypothetical protein N483_24185 [Pseudoalteromonas luteoviolacea NCIMB 1944]|nr:hypothetical protein N483_24185 [Pseudoalteromonas luteoviolacea NCIMB 1944]